MGETLVYQGFWHIHKEFTNRKEITRTIQKRAPILNFEHGGCFYIFFSLHPLT